MLGIAGRQTDRLVSTEAKTDGRTDGQTDTGVDGQQ